MVTRLYESTVKSKKQTQIAMSPIVGIILKNGECIKTNIRREPKLPIDDIRTHFQVSDVIMRQLGERDHDIRRAAIELITGLGEYGDYRVLHDDTQS
jgi:hypothetical protein